MTAAVVIRRALVAERALLESLQWRASLNNPGDRPNLLAHPDAIHLPAAQIDEGRVFVAELADAVVGFAAVLPREDGNAEIDALFVEPARWRQGIGRALVDHCVSTAREMGARSVHVVGNPHAERFYRACGFQRVGTHETRFGQGLLMVRPVGAAGAV